jgi:carbon-monoxide dehydrogenase medium subunit
MKPAPFAYSAPEQLDELLALLADEERDVRVIAGGQSLVPMMNFRLSAPELLIDLRRVDGLRHLRHEPDGALTVGAAVTQAQLLRDRGVRERFPLLVEGIGHIGHPQIRSRGTVCGSLAHHDPTAELCALAVALGARMRVLAAHGERTIAAEDFFVSYYETALEPGELLAEVTFPAPAPGIGWSFKEIARRRGDFALVGAIATVRRAAEAATGTGLVLFGVGDRPRRIDAVAAHVDGAVPDAARLARIPALVAEAIDPVGDLHASAEYRREVAGELAVQVLTEAWERSR